MRFLLLVNTCLSRCAAFLLIYFLLAPMFFHQYFHRNTVAIFAFFLPCFSFDSFCLSAVLFLPFLSPLLFIILIPFYVKKVGMLFLYVYFHLTTSDRALSKLLTIKTFAAQIDDTKTHRKERVMNSKITYTCSGDSLLPNIIFNETPREITEPLGKYG